MSYSKEIYEIVKEKLYQRRKKAEFAAKLRNNFFYAKFPRAKEITKNLALTSINAAKIILNSKNSKNELEKIKTQNLALQMKFNDILTRTGLKSDYLDVKYSCKNCQDTGFSDGTMCNCMKNMLKKEAYDKLNKLSPLKLSTFKNFSLEYYPNAKNSSNECSPKEKMSKIFDYCQNYANNFNENSKNLFMHGATGLGKTHLSLAIANEVLKKGFGVVYASAQNIIKKLESEQFNRFNNENSEMHFISCDLLIIDDLGTEFISSFSTSAIFNVVNSKILQNKPLIINTNLTIKELEMIYSQRFVSRIIGNHIRLNFVGDDIRQKIIIAFPKNIEIV